MIDFNFLQVSIDTSSTSERASLKPYAAAFIRTFDFRAEFNMSYVEKQFFIHMIKCFKLKIKGGKDIFIIITLKTSFLRAMMFKYMKTVLNNCKTNFVVIKR